MKVASPKELTVYKKAYHLAMRIFELSTRFPAEERYALTGQIRRSSRSTCMSLREAWATDTSLDFARDCADITAQEHAELTGLSREVGRMLGGMIAEPDGFLIS